MYEYTDTDKHTFLEDQTKKIQRYFENFYQLDVTKRWLL